MEKTKKTEEKEIKKPIKKGTTVFGETLGLTISLLVTIYLVPSLPFVTPDYSIWLPIAVTTTVVSYIFKILKITASMNAAKKLFEMGNIGTSIYSIYYLVQIFPFDFGLVGYPDINNHIRFAFRISIFALALAAFVNFIQIFSLSKEE